MVFDIPPTYDDDSKFYDVVSERKNGAAAQASDKTIRMIEHIIYRSGETSLVILEENYKWLPLGMLFNPFSPFLEVFNEILGLLESNGIMELYRRNFFYYDPLKKVEDIGPQVLTMDHLKLGFLACLIPLVMSVIVFIAELVRFYFSLRGSLRVLRKVVVWVGPLILPWILFLVAALAITLVAVFFNLLDDALK